MHWIVASLVSALFLGVYELCTKHAVRDNAVVPVLFFNTLTGAIIWVALLSVQAIHPGILPVSLVTDPLTLKHLPLSLVSVVMSLRRGSTLVAFAGGLLFFGEKNGLQKLPAVIGILMGIVLTVVG